MQLSIFEKKYGLDTKKYDTVIRKLKGSINYMISEFSTKISLRAIVDYTKIFYVDTYRKWNKNQSVTFM